MKKIILFTAFLALLTPLLIGCGDDDSSTSTSYFPYYYYFNNNNDNDYDSSNPIVETVNDITVSSNYYPSSTISIVGSGFGNFQGGGYVEIIKAQDAASDITYSITSWCNDSINITLSNLQTAISGTYYTRITTNDGVRVSGPNIVIIPNAIDNNSGQPAYAIFIGNPETSIGTYCVKDATDMHTALNGNGIFSHWTSDLFVDKETASYNRVYERMMQISTAMQSSPNSTFIFYYSGHGNANYLALEGGLTANELSELLSMMPATAHKIILIDACSSGSFLPKNFDSATAGDFRKISEDVPNVAVMAACGPINSSYVSMDLNQSEFTYALLSALGRSNASADISYVRTGLTLSELYNHVASQTYYTNQTDGETTIPVFRKIGNDCYIKR